MSSINVKAPSPYRIHPHIIQMDALNSLLLALDYA